MTQHNANDPNGGGICQSCGHDLVVAAEARQLPGGGRYRHSDGYVYCSNEYCMHHDDPHPTKADLNGPRQAA